MWMAIYNRAKSLDATYSLVGWVWLLFLAITGLSGAAVMAWASSTWSWYWTTFSWAGVAFAFIIAWLVLTSGFALISWAISRHPPLSIILPSSCKMSGEEKRLFVDLQQFVKTDLERLGERISGIFYAMRNIDMGASGDLPFFVIETINKDMIAQLSTIRKMAAGPPDQINFFTFRAALIEFFQSYRRTQEYLPKLVKATNIDPNRVGLITPWLEADQICFMSLQSLKTAHPSDKDINNIPNQSFASNNGFDRKTLSVLVVKSQLPRPTEREKQTAEQRRKKSALVLQILNIGFDPNGPTEMYVDFIVKNPGSPTTVNEWKLSVYDSTGMLSTGLMPRFIQTNFMRTNAFGAPENDNLTQHPLEQGGERRGRLGFTFLRMVADDLFGAKGLRFRITADDVSKSQVEANFTRN